METAGTPSQWRSGRIRPQLFVILVAVACGLVAAAGAVVFRVLIAWVQSLAFAPHPLAVSLAGVARQALAHERPSLVPPGLDLAWWRRLIGPLIGGALVGPFLYLTAREARGHGVPAVMEAIVARGGVIRPRVVAVKTIASAITIGTGGSAGREGPIVQIGAALGSTIGQMLRLPGRGMRTLIGCGAAAGIAATFNAPIAGALFAAEVILDDFTALQLVPLVVSSVVATEASRAVLGNAPVFAVPAWTLVSAWELVAYAGLGVVASVIGVSFGSVLWWFEKGFDRLRVPEAAKAAIGGAIVGAVGIGLPHVFGSSYGTIDAALEGKLSIGLLALLLVAKMAATSITLGSGGSGGVFAPSIFLGAMTGGAFGGLLHTAFPASTATAGAYALVGMGAVVAGATHAPLTAIILVFEMTQSIEVIPALMASCVVATLTAMFLRRESIYTMSLVHRGLDVYAEKDPNVLRALHVRDVLDPEPERIPANAPFREVLDLVVKSPHGEFFVVDTSGRLLGAISLELLRRLIFDEESLRHVVVAADLIEANRPVAHELDDLDAVFQLLQQAGASELAVVDRIDAGNLIGSVSEHAVVEAYHREALRRDLAGGLFSRVSLTGRTGTVELGGGFQLRAVDAPPSSFGRSLRELDLRGRKGIQVLLLRRRGGDEAQVRVPDPDTHIEAGDVLVVAGPRDAVQRIDAY